MAVNPTQRLEGQWIGEFLGGLSGKTILNVERGTVSEGFISVVQPPPVPPSRIDLAFTFNDDEFSATSKGFLAFESASGTLVSVDDYTNTHPEIFFPQPLVVQGKVNTKELNG